MMPMFLVVLESGSSGELAWVESSLFGAFTSCRMTRRARQAFASHIPNTIQTRLMVLRVQMCGEAPRDCGEMTRFPRREQASQGARPGSSREQPTPGSLPARQHPTPCSNRCRRHGLLRARS